MRLKNGSQKNEESLYFLWSEKKVDIVEILNFSAFRCMNIAYRYNFVRPFRVWSFRGPSQRSQLFVTSSRSSITLLIRVGILPIKQLIVCCSRFAHSLFNRDFKLLSDRRTLRYKGLHAFSTGFSEQARTCFSVNSTSFRLFKLRNFDPINRRRTIDGETQQ